MERESNRTLCRYGCGFYGNPATEGLCSTCFKKQVKKKQQPLNVLVPSNENEVSETTVQTVSTESVSIQSPTQQQQSFLLMDEATDQPEIAIDSAKEAEDVVSVESSSTSSGKEEPKGMDRKGKEKKNKNRCSTCRKKLGLALAFQCRCGGLYCSIHRYSDKHDCSFDYKEMGAEEIRRKNPVIIADKIQKL